MPSPRSACCCNGLTFHIRKCARVEFFCVFLPVCPIPLGTRAPRWKHFTTISHHIFSIIINCIAPTGGPPTLPKPSLQQFKDKIPTFSPPIFSFPASLLASKRLPAARRDEFPFRLRSLWRLPRAPRVRYFNYGKAFGTVLHIRHHHSQPGPVAFSRELVGPVFARNSIRRWRLCLVFVCPVLPWCFCWIWSSLVYCRC